MNTIISAVKTFVNDENGVTAIEYGLIAALIAAGLAIVVGNLSGTLSDAFVYIQGQVTTAMAA